MVVATNIAETSITIDDVTTCIDCGRVRQTGFDSLRGLAQLQVPPFPPPYYPLTFPASPPAL